MIDFKQLKYFLAVADARSFTRASAQAHVAQSALSRQIAQLEEEFGLRLLERHGRGVHLTEAGELLRDRAQTISRQMQQLREEIIARADTPIGEVALGIPPSLRAMLTLDVVSLYHKLFPQVVLRIVEGSTLELRELLSKGHIDLAWLSTIEPETSLVCWPIMTEDMYLVGTPTDRLKFDKPVDIKHLANLPIIQTSSPNSLRAILDSAMARKKLTSNVRLEANTLLITDLVKKGLGYTVLPFCAIYEEYQNGTISASPIKGMDVSWITAHSRDRSLSVATIKLQDLLRDRAKELIKDGTWKSARLMK